jgi:hypothetical protein
MNERDYDEDDKPKLDLRNAFSRQETRELMSDLQLVILRLRSGWTSIDAPRAELEHAQEVCERALRAVKFFRDAIETDIASRDKYLGYLKKAGKKIDQQADTILSCANAFATLGLAIAKRVEAEESSADQDDEDAANPIKKLIELAQKLGIPVETFTSSAPPGAPTAPADHPQPMAAAPA